MRQHGWLAALYAVLGIGFSVAAQQLPPPMTPAELTVWMDGRVAPLVPTAPSPPNNATNIPSTPVTLTWTSLGGRTYNVCFNTSGTFPTNTCRVVSTNTWTTPPLVVGGTYYWRINSRNSYSGSGVNSPVWTFRTASSPTPSPLALACPPNQTAQATSSAGIIVTLAQATVTGGTPPITTTYIPASGSVFPVGATSVSVTATDAGTQSRSCTFTVTVAAPTTPEPPADGYVAEFWNSSAANLPAIPTGPVVFSRVDPGIDFDWALAAPAMNVQADYWLARWTRQVTLAAGVYGFSVTSDDGVRVFLDNVPIIDQWTLHTAATYTATQTVTAGKHDLRVEYFDGTGTASLRFSYAAAQEPPPSGGGGGGVGVLWRMNCLGANYPICTSNGLWETPGYFSKTQLSSTPKGYGGIEWNALPATTQSQPYAGWGVNVSHPSGTSRFFRFSIRMATPYDASGVGDVWTDKLVIHGQGAESRVICVLAPRNEGPLMLRCARGIDGYPNGTPDMPLRLGQWDKVQVEVRNGPSGYIKAWVNNGNYASPTGASQTISLALPSSTVLGFGFYHNAAVSASGSIHLSLADLEWADAFDPNW